MGKTWKVFSSVSVQISLWKSGGLQLVLLKSLYLWKLWFSKTLYLAKCFKLSTVLIILLERTRLNQVFESFSPLLPRLLSNTIWNISILPSSISGKKCSWIKFMNFVRFLLRKKKLHSGLNFEGNLYSDDALQYCRGPVKYHWMEGSGPAFSPCFGVTLIFSLSTQICLLHDAVLV